MIKKKILFYTFLIVTFLFEYLLSSLIFVILGFGATTELCIPSLPNETSCGSVQEMQAYNFRRNVFFVILLVIYALTIFFSSFIYRKMMRNPIKK